MFKQLVTLFLLGLAALGGYKAYEKYAPDETKIAWLFENAGEGFNTMNKELALSQFAENWTHGTEDEDSAELEDFDRINRQLVGNALTYLFMNRLEQDTKAFLYKMEPQMGTLSVNLNGDLAEAKIRVDMSLKMGHKWTPIWSAEITANLQKQDGQDWRIIKSVHRTVSGRLPLNREE